LNDFGCSVYCLDYLINMFHRIRNPFLFLITIALSSLTNTFAQISINFPTERAIFQRDKNNKSTLYISGNHSDFVDRIDARLIPIQGGQALDWVTIQNNVTGGSYSGSIQATGGWYTLEVRGVRSEQIIGTAQVSKVGIGEVFIVAGQSNAQGFFNFGASGSTDDRVSCINYTNQDKNTFDLPYPEFSHLDENSNIAPRGNSAWSWGKLGDLLTAQYNVPVLFYNMGWVGSSIKNWNESITGVTYSVYNSSVPYLPAGAPFGNLRRLLQYYIPVTGVRSVLWLQGESDNFISTSSDSYYNMLKNVIETTRKETNKDLSWVISRTSYDPFKGTNAGITAAQDKIIATVPNVFAGPVTDEIQVPRIDPDKIHFYGAGLIDMAQSWKNRLDDHFFNNSHPYTNESPIQVSFSCENNNAIRLSVKNNEYHSVSWSNGQTGDQAVVGNGTYIVTAIDKNGNTISSPKININLSIQPAKPSISLDGSVNICKGSSTTLISSIPSGIMWNNGSGADRITVTTSGTFTVSNKNVYGCESISDPVVTQLLDSPLPEQPSIIAESPVTFCVGSEVKLTSNSPVTSIWSNGAHDKSITVASSGEFRVRAVDNFGCYSPYSDPVRVTVNPNPTKPLVALSGPTTFCANEQLVMTSDYNDGNHWNNGSTSKSISINQSGEYFVKQIDNNGCESTSDRITVHVNSLPPTPSITSLRPTTFCERDYTLLQSGESFAYLWSNGDVNREARISESGQYTVSARDQNGCLSPASASITVVKNPLPNKPIITPSSATTFCADASIELKSSDAVAYKWNTGSTTNLIRVNQSGTYTVQVTNQYNCLSDLSDPLSVHVLPLPAAPTIMAQGETTFCDGGSVQLLATQLNGLSYIWNNGTVARSITIQKSGSYFARARDEAGCMSSNSPTIAVDVKPNPTKPEIIKTGVFTLMAKNNLSEGGHLWRRNGIDLEESGILLKTSDSGTYTVNNSIVYSPTLTCESEFSDSFEFFFNQLDTYAVYPNPVNQNNVTIETLPNLKNATIQVYDVKGSLHKTYQIANFEKPFVVNVSDLTNGIYLIKVSSQSYHAVKKIVILK
jgi:hypothetical protein